MSPWIVGKPQDILVYEKPPACIHLKVITDHMRECHLPKFLSLNDNKPAKCMFTADYLRDCFWYDSGDPNDKHAIKKEAKP